MESKSGTEKEKEQPEKTEIIQEKDVLMESLKLANKSFESNSPTHRARSVTVSIGGTLTSIMLPSQYDQKPTIPNKSTKPRSLTIQENGNRDQKIGNVAIRINNSLISSSSMGMGKDGKTNSGFLGSVPSYQPLPDDIEGNKGNKTGSHHDRTRSFERGLKPKSGLGSDRGHCLNRNVSHSRHVSGVVQLPEQNIGEDQNPTESSTTSDLLNETRVDGVYSSEKIDKERLNIDVDDRVVETSIDETKKSSHDDELKRNQKVVVLHSRENSIDEDHGVMLVKKLSMARKVSVVGGFRKIPTPSESFGANYLLVKSDKEDEFDEEYVGPIQKLSVSQIKKESATPRRSSVARPAPLLQQSQQ